MTNETPLHIQAAKSKLANLLGINKSTVICPHVTVRAGGFVDCRLFVGDLAITCRVMANGGWAGSETWHDNFAQISAGDVVRRYSAKIAA
jgi:hypothetical protein